jgi:hypothetical protein
MISKGVTEKKEIDNRDGHVMQLVVRKCYTHYIHDTLTAYAKKQNPVELRLSHDPAKSQPVSSFQYLKSASPPVISEPT